MLLSVLILHAGPAQLRLLCAGGFSIGLIAFLFGFRRGPRSSTTLSASTGAPRLNSIPTSPKSDHVPEPAASMPQVIRLSLPPVSVRTAEMSQQQKVAAALIRAGIANPASWTDSSASSEPAHPDSASARVAVAELPSLSMHSIKPAPPSAGPARSTLQRILLIAGPVLSLLSLYLFLRVH